MEGVGGGGGLGFRFRVSGLGFRVAGLGGGGGREYQGIKTRTPQVVPLLKICLRILFIWPLHYLRYL